MLIYKDLTIINVSLIDNYRLSLTLLAIYKLSFTPLGINTLSFIVNATCDFRYRCTSLDVIGKWVASSFTLLCHVAAADVVSAVMQAVTTCLSCREGVEVLPPHSSYSSSIYFMKKPADYSS